MLFNALLSFKNTVRLPAAAMKKVVLVQALETAKDPKIIWSDDDRDRASRDARQLAGEKADRGQYLLTRADLVLARVKNQIDAPGKLTQTHFAGNALLGGFALVAYLIGCLTDRLATQGSVINLLSPPLLGLLLWNLAVYLMLIINGTAGLLGHGFTLPLRAKIASALAHLRWTGLKRAPLKSRFLSHWLKLLAPAFSLQAARAFHLGALAFALGLITSMAVRGIGTHYVIGWESTWFADNVAVIDTILRYVYGLLPLDTLGVAPLPSIDVVASMRLDSVDFVAVPTAPWLIRIMAIIGAVIIVPRLVLFLRDTFLLKRFFRRMPVNVSTPYFQTLLSDKVPQDDWLCFIPADMPASQQNDWQTLWRQTAQKAAVPQAAVRPYSVWEDDPETLAGALTSTGKTYVTLIMSISATPEEEVHGALLDALTENLNESASPAPLVLLDATRLKERHGQDAPLLESRTALWESFVSRHGCDQQLMPDTPAAALEAVAGHWRPSKD